MQHDADNDSTQLISRSNYVSSVTMVIHCLVSLIAFRKLGQVVAFYNPRVRNICRIANEITATAVAINTQGLKSYNRAPYESGPVFVPRPKVRLY